VTDPWQVLGLSPGASVSDARAARRRLAKQLHPDVHGARRPEDRADLERRMTTVNEALAAVIAAISTAGASAAPGSGAPYFGAPVPPEPRGSSGHPAVAAGADDGTVCIEALPVRAFEALFVVAYGLGEILDEDEPYCLDLYLPVPDPCFCHLDLVPDAGGSIITVSVSAAEGADAPPVAAVRDLLVAELDALAER
jgi:hypothetical protein